MQSASESGGLTVRGNSFYWPCHGDCTEPVHRDFKSGLSGDIRTGPLRFVKVDGQYDYSWPVNDHSPIFGEWQGKTGQRNFFIDISVRCRKCPACLRYRGRLWTARAISETVWAEENLCRTWFLTFTLSPAVRVRAPWDAKMMKRAFQLFAKKLRKKEKFRYLLAVEFHKDGTPHLHALVHEMRPDRPITKKTMEGFWKLGFTRIKLVRGGPAAASYVSKYMSKDLLTGRVPCSLGYGRPSGKAKRENDIAELLRQYLDSPQSGAIS